MKYLKRRKKMSKKKNWRLLKNNRKIKKKP